MNDSVTPPAAFIAGAAARLAALLVCVWLLIAALPAQAQRQLMPVDQAPMQPDFFSFRAQLQAAVGRRDVEAVLAVVHPDIKNSFGGNDGVAEFKQLWKLDRPNSPLWGTLATVLALGGSFEGQGTFIAPYVFSRWPQEFDGYGHVAIVGSNVRVRSAPSATAASVARLSFAIVERIETAPANDDWVAVRLSDGAKGYVDSGHARSPIDYRAFFEKSDGRWQMRMLIAGD